MVSVLILTYNEEMNLPGCLQAVQWSDDVLVFDSFSTDHTTEIARAAGVRLMQREFDNYGGQREAARTMGNFKHPWVLALDADERPDVELVSEIKAVGLAGELDVHAYRMRRKDQFMGKWIKNATLYPSWFVRLFQHGRIQYEERAVHEYPRVNGPTGELKGHLIHHSFNKGLGDWWRKHIKYAELEAAENVKSLEQDKANFKGLLSIDPVVRRRALKHLSLRMPCRPTLRFLYMYLLRRGFLDGLAGYHYCRLLSMYEYMIVLNLREREQSQRP